MSDAAPALSDLAQEIRDMKKGLLRLMHELHEDLVAHLIALEEGRDPKLPPTKAQRQRAKAECLALRQRNNINLD
jgi:hypothetical protein